MLDVHPANHAASTWKDFFIHIATIVIGLLIAVGLEQTVEYIHHRHGVVEARERIRAEIEVNDRVVHSDREQSNLLLARMNRNLEILRAARTPRSDPAATLDFTWGFQNCFDAAYSGAKESGDLGRMPYAESAAYEDAYTGLTIHTEAGLEVIKQIYIAKALHGGRPAASLSAPESAALAAAITSAIGKIEYFQIVTDLEQESWESLLAGKFRNDIGGTTK